MLICFDQIKGTGCGSENPTGSERCSWCGRSLFSAILLADPGDQIGVYRIIKMIGRGGFGAVYEAEDTRSYSFRVALKQTFDIGYIDSFLSEFAVLSRLMHQNLPRYYDVFDEDDNGFLVMEYIRGQSLQELLDRQQAPLLENQVLSYALQLCDVLSYLHGQQPPILHRDIKPANIRLTPEGLIKLVDFGLFKEGTQTTRVSRRGLTRAYAPIEQWSSFGQHTDARSDIYSFGATLYHLITNHEPPPATDRPNMELTSPLQYNPRVSETIANAIIKAMSTRKEERFPSAAAFKRSLMGGDLAENKPSLQQANKAEKQNEVTSTKIIRKDVRKIGRNELCPCGSGKKFRHCHEGREAELARLLSSGVSNVDKRHPSRKGRSSTSHVNTLSNDALSADQAVDSDNQVKSKTPVLRIARNAPCPCGSGKKFKYCHEGREQELTRILVSDSKPVVQIQAPPSKLSRGRSPSAKHPIGDQALTDKLALSENLAQVAQWISNNKIGRNELCPCGSGKKFKYCHENHVEDLLRVLASKPKPEIQTIPTEMSRTRLLNSNTRTTRRQTTRLPEQPPFNPLWPPAKPASKPRARAYIPPSSPKPLVPLQPRSLRRQSRAVTHTKLVRPSYVFEGHDAAIQSVIYDPSGQVITSASGDGTVRLWRISDGSLLKILAQPPETWSVSGDTEPTVLQVPDWINDLTFSPDGQTLAVATHGGFIRLWDMATGTLVCSLQDHMTIAWSIGFASDGQTLVSASGDQIVRIWRISDNTIFHVLRPYPMEGHRDQVVSVAWGPDNQTLASASYDGTVRLWNVFDWTLLHILQGRGGWVYSITYSPDGQRIASADKDGNIWIWQVATGELLNLIQGHSKAIREVAWSPDGNIVASASYDGTVKLWKAIDGSLSYILQAQQTPVLCVSWHPDSQSLATGSRDQRVRMWEL